MAAPVIGTRPRYAPRAGATIDRTHPLAAGLEFCFVPAIGNVDLVRGLTGTPTGNPAPATSAYGPARSVVRSPATGWKFQNQMAGLLGSISALWVGRFATVNTNFACILSTTDNTNCPIDISYQSTNRIQLIRTGTVNYDCWLTSTTPAANTDYIFTTSYNDGGATGTAPVSYLNGVRQTHTHAATGSGPVSAGTIGLGIGVRANDATPSDSTTSIVALWSRAISEAEASTLYADPYCFLKV